MRSPFHPNCWSYPFGHSLQAHGPRFYLQRKWFIRENRFIFCSMTINDNAFKWFDLFNVDISFGRCLLKENPVCVSQRLKKYSDRLNLERNYQVEKLTITGGLMKDGGGDKVIYRCHLEPKNI